AVMYRTGDRARYLPDGNLEFLGRLDFQVKIRGFRIELGEIESVLAEHPGVAQAVAAVREDSPGDRRLVAYFVPAEGAPEGAPEPGAQELRAWVHARLPEYMVPSAFVALAAIPLTANGKVDRKALPAPDAARRAGGADYAPPASAAESLLARIWGELLGLDRVSVHDNFFELGGDSILSIQIISRAGQAGLHLTARQVFQHQTIAELAAVAESAPTVRAEQGAVTGAAPLTPVERWFFEQELPAAHHWNQSLLLEATRPLDPGLVRDSVDALLLHHDALRLAFRQGAEGWTQEILPPGAGPRAFGRVDLGRVAASDPARASAAIEAVSASVQASLDLGAGNLLRAVAFDLGAARNGRLLIVAHHLAIDGVSWRLLLEDLQIAYGQLARGEAVALPGKTTSFLEWAERLALHARSDEVRAELPFWAGDGALGTLGAVPPIPIDGERGANAAGDAEVASLWLDAEATRALLAEVPPVYRTQVNDVLLAGFARSLSAWTGSAAIQVDLEGHGREEIAADLDVSRTVGWFTALYPVRLDLAGTAEGSGAGPGGALRAVKERLRAIPNRGLGFGLLRYLGDEEARAALSRAPASEISFNYLGQLDQALPEASPFLLARENAGPAEDPAQPRRFLLDVAASVLGGRMELTATFGGNVHRRATIERLLDAFARELRAIVEHCRQPEAGGFTPSDFPLARIDQGALDRLLAPFPDRGRNVEEIY
ncbi:MAG TPA: condensation domain-containing protein, partial [Thermoanaerobaculia bacterium]|nr:condensation domain-containing protein [Thermoanaerobaculia bacterium]